MPKLPPPPRSAQNRSGFSRSLARRNSPSAVTTSAETRLSKVRPNLRLVQPKPPPSVRPAMPVVELMPVGVARPNACVSRSKSPSVAPGSTRASARDRIDAHRLHRRQIDHHAAVAAPRCPRCCDRRRAPATTAPAFAREIDGGAHVGRAGAAHDQTGPAVDHAVPDGARRVIARLARGQHRATQAALQRVDGGFGNRNCAARQLCQIETGHVNLPRIARCTKDAEGTSERLCPALDLSLRSA